jgi:hypothetical protein
VRDEGFGETTRGGYTKEQQLGGGLLRTAVRDEGFGETTRGGYTKEQQLGEVFTKDSREGRGVWGNNAWRLH